ncbi:hypothetical protein ACFVXC_22915 [Streptomyces sp. NPDC058257]|uniref:hypothetical protein n=1 Tax=Streptomyces sp. NPDC058257 TaxID=3346409 RepID=UPI0036E0FA3E
MSTPAWGVREAVLRGGGGRLGPVRGDGADPVGFVDDSLNGDTSTGSTDSTDSTKR